MLQAKIERRSQKNCKCASSSALTALQSLPFTAGNDDTASSLLSQGNTTETKRNDILSLCFDKPRSLVSPINDFTSWMTFTLTLENEDNDDILDFSSQHEHLFPTTTGIYEIN